MWYFQCFVFPNLNVRSISKLRLVDMFLVRQGCSFPPRCIETSWYVFVLAGMLFSSNMHIPMPLNFVLSCFSGAFGCDQARWFRIFNPSHPKLYPFYFWLKYLIWDTMDKDFGQTRNPILSNKNLICYCFGRDALPPKSRFRYSCLAKCHSRYSSVISNFPSIPS